VCTASRLLRRLPGHSPLLCVPCPLVERDDVRLCMCTRSPLRRSPHFDFDLPCETPRLLRLSNTLAYGTCEFQVIILDEYSIIQPQTMSIAATKLHSPLLKISQTWKRLPSTRNPDLAPTLSICY